ncbi:MAG TPA: hypothetical protein VGE05_12565, partial [Novosphingobium sp.]
MPDPEEEATEGASRSNEAREAARGMHWFLRVVKWLAISLVSLAILIGVGIFVLDTGLGRRFVADQIQALEFETGMKIRVERIEGSIYGRMVLRNFSVSDTKGEFLFSPQMVVDWRPFSYFSNHVD